MKIPLSWLKDYVDVDLPPEEIAARLTMAGTEVGAIERTAEWDGVVVGRVLDVRQHPNADRLTVVNVETDAGVAEVVCGATNVAAGQKIAFAHTGAELVDAHTGEKARLKRAKIRGVLSHGMVCSRRELGLGDEHDGIMVLEPDSVVGTPLAEHLGDTILDLELTPNRPDCLGVLGVAREVAALTGKQVREPAVDFASESEPVDRLARVVIEEPDLCPRYTASVIRGVKIGPSPAWLAERIEKLGERPINNVVDVTNYVMFELGQPLHAFDYDTVQDHTVVVRRAGAGERLITLDGEERELGPDMLVIADPKGAIGLAGVMGGSNSEIGDETTSVLLESANFNGPNNRRTARSLGLTSQATLRFEKGLRPELSEVALRRATGMIVEVAGGAAARGIIDEWPGESGIQRWVDVTAVKIRSVLGVDFNEEQVRSTLGSLGFLTEPLSGKTATEPAQVGWRVTIPYWRPDISIPEDICEELARAIGYEEIPSTVLAGRVPAWMPLPHLDLRERVRDALAAAGMQETISYVASTAAGQEAVQSEGGLPPPIRLFNPVSSGHDHLRTTLREGVLNTLRSNSRTWRGPLALFEVGRVFLRRDEDLPEEREVAVGALAGPRSELHWLGTEGALDFYDAKGVVEAVAEDLGIEVAFVKQSDAAFADGRAALLTAPAAGGASLGVVGELSGDVLSALDIDLAPVALFELDLAALASALAATGRDQSYRPFSRLPESVRDLALLADDETPAGEIVRIAGRNRLVKSVRVFDVYRGGGLPPEKKSLAVRVTYQSPSRTLTAEEVSRGEQSILRALKEKLGVELRS